MDPQIALARMTMMAMKILMNMTRTERKAMISKEMKMTMKTESTMGDHRYDFGAT